MGKRQKGRKSYERELGRRAGRGGAGGTRVGKGRRAEQDPDPTPGQAFGPVLFCLSLQLSVLQGLGAQETRKKGKLGAPHLFLQNNLKRRVPLADFTTWWLSTQLPKWDRSRITGRIFSPSASFHVYEMGIVILATSPSRWEDPELRRVKM